MGGGHIKDGVKEVAVAVLIDALTNALRPWATRLGEKWAAEKAPAARPKKKGKTK